MMAKRKKPVPPAPCTTYGKQDGKDCSRAECANRRPLGAQQSGSLIGAGATVRRPHFFDN